MHIEDHRYPRILLVALGRINRNDIFNNGMLLRNLFGPWPRDCLAQIYSSGDNGDEGFCGDYYKLGPCDRNLGGFFYRIKTEAIEPEDSHDGFQIAKASITGRVTSGKSWLRNCIVDSGLYEYIFKPKLSEKLISWVSSFRPDIIFAQGYNLTFTWLPILLKQEASARLAFFCSDDWPTYLYKHKSGVSALIARFVRPSVVLSARKLISSADIAFSFGSAMSEEYSKRYGRSFIQLAHSDNPIRFESAYPLHVALGDSMVILALGSFNEYRWPLLLDINECCRRLAKEGVRVRLIVMAVNIDPAGRQRLSEAEFIDILPDPGNDLIPSYLKGADILLLAEGFDKQFVEGIRLSVSSKAHLYMFSRRPAIVYAHPDTGVARYAKRRQWARIVSARDIDELCRVIKELLLDPTSRESLIARAYSVAIAEHSNVAMQARFRNALIDVGAAR